MLKKSLLMTRKLLLSTSLSVTNLQVKELSGPRSWRTTTAIVTIFPQLDQSSYTRTVLSSQSAYVRRPSKYSTQLTKG